MVGIAESAEPLPNTRVVARRRSWPASVTTSSSACVPPLRTADARALKYTGSPQASYTQRLPSTECCVVAISDNSAPARGAPR